jgi:hypothetical protein
MRNARSNLTAYHCCEGLAGWWPLPRAVWCSEREVLQLPLAGIDRHNPCNIPLLPSRTLFHLREITAWRSGSDNTSRKITSANRFSISATSTQDICPCLAQFVLCRDSSLIPVFRILHVVYSLFNVFPFDLTFLLCFV